MNLYKLTLGVLFSIILTASTASANHHRTVVDYKGKHVRSTNGNCVRTMWMSDHDACGKHDVLNPTWVFFDFNKSNIRESEMHKLNRVAHYINHHGIQTVNIHGYADRIGGHSAYNDRLSKRRAMTVYDYLQSRTNVEKMTADVEGYGATHQVKACHDVKEGELINCLQPNRRVEVFMDQ